MKIPKDTMERWSGLKVKGDADRIVAKMDEGDKVHPEVIRVGLRSGEFKNLAAFKAVCAFYNEREIEVNEALSGNGRAKSNDGVHTTWLAEEPKQQVTNTTFLDKRRADKNKIK